MDDVRAAIREAMDEWRMPGFSVAVVAPDMAWAEGFGLADVENDVPATAQTVYRMASISKPITATAVLHLAERGKLDLDAPIQRYVRTFPEKPWPITARLLLGHLGGIRDTTDAESRNAVHHPYGAAPLETFLDPVCAGPLQYRPGTTFRYSTPGYVLLGCAIEGASGTDYLSYVQEHILGPAGMSHTQPDDLHAIVPHRARGYARDPSGALRNANFADTSDHLPAGGFCGTVGDVARFGSAFQQGRLLTAGSMTHMLARQRMENGRETRFGLGWFSWTYRGEQEAAHGGKHHGTSTMLSVRMTSGISIALMTNLQAVSSPYMHSLARRIGDIVLGRRTGCSGAGVA
jgi:CubicO group peptidase (beta-lactamase class C family)